jgi:hypothetical protein
MELVQDFVQWWGLVGVGCNAAALFDRSPVRDSAELQAILTGFHGFHQSNILPG